MTRNEWRDLGYLLAFCGLLWLFAGPLVTWAPRDLKVFHSYHSQQRVGFRVYDGQVYTLKSRALSSLKEQHERWRGGHWRAGELPDNIYEGPVEFSEQYDEYGFVNEAGLKTVDIACLGDSQTESGWPNDLNRASDWVVGNYGVAALPLIFQWDIFEQFIKDKKPKLLILGIYCTAINEFNFYIKGYERGDLAMMPRGPLENQIGWAKKYQLPESMIDSTAGRYGVILLSRLRAARKAYSRWSVLEPLSFKARSRPPAIAQFVTYKDAAHKRERSLVVVPRRAMALRSSFTRGDLARFEQCLQRFEGRCTELGVRLAFVYLPLKERAAFDSMKANMSEAERCRAFDCSLEELKAMDAGKDHLPGLLADIAKSLGVPVFDASPVLIEAYEQGHEPWFLTDSHFNRDGNRRVGEAVARWLKTSLKQPLRRPAWAVKRQRVEALKPGADGHYVVLCPPELRSKPGLHLALDIKAEKRVGLRLTGRREQKISCVGFGQERRYYWPVRAGGLTEAGALRIENDSGRPWTLVQASWFWTSEN